MSVKKHLIFYCKKIALFDEIRWEKLCKVNIHRLNIFLILYNFIPFNHFNNLIKKFVFKMTKIANTVPNQL